MDRGKSEKLNKNIAARKAFLPVSRDDMIERGWDECDFVIITGDAYVDHPSFGTAIISRVLESRGYRVGIISQPDYTGAGDFRRLGRPRLGFLINSGNVDSMVNHFSVSKRRRSTDEYSPGGLAGRRPDRAVIVYANRAREAFPGVPIIIGGLEASLRRMGHYDYWEDKVRRSILLDSKADLLIYGMGERAVVEIAEALDAGISIHDIHWIRGTCFRAKKSEIEDDIASGDIEMLPDFSDIASDKRVYAKSFAMQYRNNNCISGKRQAEGYDGGFYVVQNLPQSPLERMELDDVYELPYAGTYHPDYEEAGGVPAIKEVEFSIISSRGCFGGCAFCALTYHQGREVRSRSKESIVREAERLTKKPNFKGYIHDVGGPTANFRQPACEKQLTKGVCKNRECLYPHPCANMNVDHSEYIDVLRAVRSIEGVKKVFIRSGIRYDYVLADKDDEFLRELVKYHISGTLKVAPEHVSPKVLKYMGKPERAVFDAFCAKYKALNDKYGLRQYLIPYLISSHPGSTLDDAIELALYLKKFGFVPDQVQDFYPTPGTLATCMYYTELDPFTMRPVYVAKLMREKHMQRALIHFNKPENRKLVLEALRKANREDLIPVLLPTGKGKDVNTHRTDSGDRGRRKAVQSNNQRSGERKHHAAKNNGRGADSRKAGLWK
ncbi:MAG: YgiQ family radical SAM protein [Firmicutes bacterium]|nr:YgiQ family radical SAM protein [Bacillota bacterium]